MLLEKIKPCFSVPPKLPFSGSTLYVCIAYILDTTMLNAECYRQKINRS